jgi:hypothetical protein
MEKTQSLQPAPGSFTDAASKFQSGCAELGALCMRVGGSLEQVTKLSRSTHRRTRWGGPLEVDVAAVEKLRALLASEVSTGLQEISTKTATLSQSATDLAAAI